MTRHSTSPFDPLLRVRARLRADEGFTLIEIMVAAFVLVIGLLSTATVLTGSSKLATVSERQATAASIAQCELERIQSLDYAAVAMPSSTYPTSAASNNPAFYVNKPTTGQYEWDQTAANFEALVPPPSPVPAGVTLDTTADPYDWSDQSTPCHATRFGGSVYRFITAVLDPTCASLRGDPTNPCSASTTTDYKRITVAVTLNGTTAPRKPVYLAGLARPASADNPLAPGNGSQCANPDPSQGTTCYYAAP